ncbi:uncharacterized protein N7477_004343 [Penicillium maclennaniae]|uniref:uncharacterized protein n=1 Tax=Penicillium maclennaniae TaxID=1343394 RepID=UPI00254197B8|nr:uncharacterized protein N7477_004343 [Penicillium maclennaniae]KAJ5674409.1 hypothetical protein N7477_004343 [Penicillium maclennaniae]
MPINHTFNQSCRTCIAKFNDNRLTNIFTLFHSIYTKSSQAMAGFTIQRSPTGPLTPRPRTDVELAKDAWKYLSQKVEKRRQKQASKSESSTKSYDTDSKSITSNADTLIGDKSNMKKGMK